MSAQEVVTEKQEVCSVAVRDSKIPYGWAPCPRGVIIVLTELEQVAVEDSRQMVKNLCTFHADQAGISLEVRET